MNTQIKSYIQQFSDVFNGNPWLDETFAKKLDSLTAQQAFTAAPDNNHTVAEVVSHIIIWREELLCRLANNSSKRLLTEEGDDWKPLQALQQTGWPQLFSAFKQSQQQLISFLESRDDDFLRQPHADTRWNNEYFVAGLLHHDLYHLGQIGLILKWAR